MYTPDEQLKDPGDVVLHRYYGREVFYELASGKCQWGEGLRKVLINKSPFLVSLSNHKWATLIPNLTQY